jgi:hypothetical protein
MNTLSSPLIIWADWNVRHISDFPCYCPPDCELRFKIYTVTLQQNCLFVLSFEACVVLYEIYAPTC